MPFARTWMDLKKIILNETRQRQISYDITYMWNLKYNTKEFIYQTKTTHTEIRIMVTKVERNEGGMDGEYGISRCKLLYTE